VGDLGYLLMLLRFGWGGEAGLLGVLMLESGRQRHIQTLLIAREGHCRNKRRQTH